MASVDWMTDMLTLAVDGRPCTVYYTPGTDQAVAHVYNDDKSKHVSFEISESDLRDPGFKERTLVPALLNLDSATFPERHKRSMEAIKRVAKSLATSAA